MMPENSQLLALAKLDGWSQLTPEENMMVLCGTNKEIISYQRLREFKYLTSRDAIIPLVLKQPEYIQVQIFSSFAKKFKHPTAERYISELFVGWLHLTPSQIAEALLRAVGEWREE